MLGAREAARDERAKTVAPLGELVRCCLCCLPGHHRSALSLALFPTRPLGSLALRAPRLRRPLDVARLHPVPPTGPGDGTESAAATSDASRRLPGECHSQFLAARQP